MMASGSGPSINDVQSFKVLVNPVPTGEGADYAHHITVCPPGFENMVLTSNLQIWCANCVSYYLILPIRQIWKIEAAALKSSKNW